MKERLTAWRSEAQAYAHAARDALNDACHAHDAAVQEAADYNRTGKLEWEAVRARPPPSPSGSALCDSHRRSRVHVQSRQANELHLHGRTYVLRDIKMGVGEVHQVQLVVGPRDVARSQQHQRSLSRLQRARRLRRATDAMELCPAAHPAQLGLKTCRRHTHSAFIFQSNGRHPEPVYVPREMKFEANARGTIRVPASTGARPSL